MSSPDKCRLYHSTVFAIDVLTSQRGFHPRRVLALELSNLKTFVSCRAELGGRESMLPSPHCRATCSTMAPTVMKESSFEPKFHAPESSAGAACILTAKMRYPYNGSSTCCHGLTDRGLR